MCCTKTIADFYFPVFPGAYINEVHAYKPITYYLLRFVMQLVLWFKNREGKQEKASVVDFLA